jgi:hypothetical protein
MNEFQETIGDAEIFYDKYITKHLDEEGYPVGPWIVLWKFQILGPKISLLCGGWDTLPLARDAARKRLKKEREAIAAHEQ